MKKLTILIAIFMLLAVFAQAVISQSEENGDDEHNPESEPGSRGSRGYALADDIKVDVLGTTDNEIYNLAGIGGNSSSYSLYAERNWTHQYLSSNTSSLYDTVWHPTKQYSLVVGANHSYDQAEPTRAPAAFVYEGSTYTDICDLTVFDDDDWLWGVDFDPDGTVALIVGDYGGVWKFHDGNKTVTSFKDTNSTNRSYYDVEYYANGTEALLVGYNGTAGAGIIDIYTAANDTIWSYYANAAHGLYRCVSINSDGVALIGEEGGLMLNYNASNATVSTINDVNQIWWGCDWNVAGDNATFVGYGEMIYSTNGTTYWEERACNASNRTLYDVAWNRNDSFALVVGNDSWAAEWTATTYTNVSHNITSIHYYCVNYINVNFTYSGIYRYISTVIVAQISVTSGSLRGIAVNYTIERLGVTYRSGNGTTDSYGNMIWEWNTDVQPGFFYTVRAWVRNKVAVENTTQVGVVVNPGVWVYFQNAPQSTRENEWTAEFQVFSNSTLLDVTNLNATLQIKKYNDRTYTNLYAKNLATDAWGNYQLSVGPTLTTSAYVLNNYYIVDLHIYNHTGPGWGSLDTMIDFNGSAGSPASDRGGVADIGPSGTYKQLKNDESHVWYYQDNNSDGAYTITDDLTEPLMCQNITNILYIVNTGVSWIPLSSASNWNAIYWVDWGNTTHIWNAYDDAEDIYLDDGDGLLNATGTTYSDEDGFDGTYFISTFHAFKVTTPVDVNRSATITVSLSQGWNMIGMSETMLASVLANKSAYIQTVVHMTAQGNSGILVTYIATLGATDFTCTRREGVWVYASQADDITFTETL